MNVNVSDLTIQIAATVIGGIILFLFGLLYSALSRRTKDYMNWIATNGRLVVMFLLLIYVFSNLSVLMSPQMAQLSFLFALAMVLFILHTNDSIGRDVNRKLEAQKKATNAQIEQLRKATDAQIKQLTADLFLIDIHYWELREVDENVLAYCYKALDDAPDNYQNTGKVLTIIEDTLNKLMRNSQNLSIYRKNELHEILGKMPARHDAQAKRIIRLVDSFK